MIVLDPRLFVMYRENYYHRVADRFGSDVFKEKPIQTDYVVPYCNVCQTKIFRKATVKLRNRINVLWCDRIILFEDIMSPDFSDTENLFPAFYSGGYVLKGTEIHCKNCDSELGSIFYSDDDTHQLDQIIMYRGNVRI